MRSDNFTRATSILYIDLVETLNFLLNNSLNELFYYESIDKI